MASTTVAGKDSADYIAKWVSSTGGAYDFSKGFVLASQYAQYLPLNEAQKTLVHYIGKAATTVSSALFLPLFINEANDFRREQNGPAAASLVNTACEVVYFLKLSKILTFGAKVAPIVDIIYNGSSLLTDVPTAIKEYENIQTLQAKTCRSFFEQREVELQLAGSQNRLMKCSSSIVMAVMSFAALYFATLAATTLFTVSGLILSTVYLKGSATKAFYDLALDEHRQLNPPVPLYLRV